MTIRRVLILTPILVILFLLQSYFWVPTYEQQSRGNPDRLNEYITASIGDASILNPILSADSASSQIQSLVFEGLIDYDEELRFRGRLAHSWEVFEEAFFYVNESEPVPGLGRARGKDVVDFIIQAKQRAEISEPRLKACLNNIKEISLIPSSEFVATKQEKDPGEPKNKTQVQLHFKAPARVKLTLASVDQGLF
jgi:hypothetical protein